ncbi:hypothetical protein Cal6303_5656 (plasmid) [Calothrix sp. PCC 6303]|jgi:hypothetical protein|nr:hypothetical protein Cal6303_5656 [Calothrix sp. PCC 6303]
MSQVTHIWDSTLLRKSAVYQINGFLYRYLYKDGSIKHSSYHFRPLAGQKIKADLKLNHNKLTSCCYEVEGIRATRNTTVTDKTVQLSLF